MTLFRHLPYLLLIAFLASAAVQANPRQNFDVLAGAPIDDELPAQSPGSAASVNRTLRPALSYPTLRLDERERRPAAISQAPALRATQLAAGVTSDFAELVGESLGVKLPRFGRDVFHSETRGYSASDQMPVPADFVLGPGDEVYLRAWGTIEIDYRATIDRLGEIAIPKVGTVPLAGVRYSDLRTHLRAAIGRVFKGFELSVSLGQLKTIQIYVAGFARSPGSYTIPSLSGGINALFAAGGPAPAGDLRRLVLRREGQDLHTFDLYRLLIEGDMTDVRLMPNDVLYIPPQRGEVAIAGAVNAPAVFQFSETDTLGDLIRFAGGLGTTADTHRITIESINADGDRLVESLELNESSARRQLRPGDLAVVTPVNMRIDDAVTLRGHVANPFRHPFSPGMRISDLIPSREALISPRYWLERNRESQWISGAKREPGGSFSDNLPDVNWEYAALERLNADTLTSELIAVRLDKAVLERDPAFDLVLQPGDVLTVYALDDFRVRRTQRPRFVRIEGEVGRSGVYSLTPGDGLEELIRLAGGTTDMAYLFGLELRRESVRARQAARINESIDQLEREYQRHLIERSRNVLSGDLSLAIPPESDAIAHLIARLREAKPTGRMVLELEPGIAVASELPTLGLTDGDTVYVPARPETIEVVGAVIREGSFLYSEGRGYKGYIEHAGPIPSANLRQIYVLRPDGTFVKASRKLALAPGDAIVIPEKVDRATWVRRLKDWTQVLYQFGLGAAGLKILEGL
ncbi:MAG: SLBB domain-containing protein [Pseudomonadota bacterium]